MFTTELKGEIRVLKNHTPLPTTPNMVTNEIERMVLRTVESLLPKQDTPDDTYITNPDLAVTVLMNLNAFIDNVTNTALATFKTAQTNELALKKISVTSNKNSFYQGKRSKPRPYKRARLYLDPFDTFAIEASLVASRPYEAFCRGLN